MADATLGRFVWHELLTTDVKAAGAFYGKVVGWKTQPFGNDGVYTLFTKGGRPLAGLMLLPDEAKSMGAPPNWMTYVGTRSVDDTARKATSLGGKVIKDPENIPNAGRFAVVQDPQGAVFGIYQENPAAEAAAGTDAGGMGDFSWHELSTTDWKAALRFYQKLFGWQAMSAMDMGPEMGTYQMYGLDGKPMGGIMNKPKTQPGPPAWLPYIQVPDAKKVVPLTTKNSGKLIHGPEEVPGGDFIAVAFDPQGAVFAVHSVTAPAKATAAAVKPTPSPAQPSKTTATPEKAAPKSAAPRKAMPKRTAAKKGAPKTAARKAVKKAATKPARKVASTRAAKRAPKKPARKNSAVGRFDRRR